MGNRKNAEAWKEAKKRCRLNSADIQMAKELGMKSKSLLKNIPSRNQQWKAPVKVWIGDLYEKKFGRVLTVKQDPNKASNKKQSVQQTSISSDDWDDLPF
ncbi:hypothetical protein [Aquibacillus salsiterrae]|uniref:Uncharacterized protein n=1 Tax=Aquibacillus salsiterrae TaxID=2950439 RepID=A0A9X4AH86_9BACI|nr:hypothetical protein [Aquibacillus salsiterrae]MDC3418075.1 hypothetical protein [Aquibacillus salsiterrae]